MTKREAWETIANAFALAAEGGFRSDVARNGLCYAIANLPIDFEMFTAMDADLCWANPHPKHDWTKADGHWWPIPVGLQSGHTTDCDFERAMLAQLLAESSEDT